MGNANINGLKNLVNLTKGYFLTTVINQALPFLLLPILTRFMTTSEFGLLSLLTFYLSISSAVVGVSIPTVISKYFYEWNQGNVARLLGNCIYSAFFLALLVASVILVTYPFLKEYLAIPLPYLLIMPIGSFAQIVFSLGLTVCRCSKSVFHFSCHQIGNTSINVLFSLITVCLFLWGWQGRFVSICMAYAISAFVMLFYLRKKGFLDFAFSHEYQKEIRRVIMPLIPNSVQLNLISQAGLFFMQLYFGKDILGKYAMAFQISFCVKLLIDTINMSWSPYLFQQLAKGEKMNQRYVARCLLVLFAVLLLGTIVANLLALPILWIMTTADYYSAIEFIPYFTLGWFIYGVYCFLHPILIKFNQQKYIGLSSMISMLVMIALNIVFAKSFGYMGIPLAFCVVYLTLSIPLIYRAQLVCPLPWKKALKIW